nr:hypothetical protein [Tanacetum cinerariifolium]
ERAATTASSLEVEHDSGDTPTQTRFKRLSKQSHEPLLLKVNTLGSGEDIMQLMELMALCTTLSDRVLALENNKIAQDLEITHLKKREDASNQGRNDQDEGISFVQEDVRTQGSAPITIAGVPVSTAGISVSTVEPSTPPTTTAVIEDEDLTIAQTLMKMGSVKSKEKSKEKGVSSTRLTRGVIIREASETASRPIVSPQQQLNTKDKGKDYELAQRLQAKEQGELIIEERSKLFVELMDKRKKHFAKLRAEKIRRKTPTKAQKRNQMCSFVSMDSEVVEGSKIQTEGSKKRTRKELDEERVKRQKLKDDTEKAELKLCLEIVPKDDEDVNVKSLATKYPIVDWKTHILDEDKIYYQIIRADGRRIVGIKRLLSAVEVTAADMEVTTAGSGYNCKLWLLLLLKIIENILSHYYC